MSPLVQPLAPMRLVHNVPIRPVRIQLLDGCELRIIPAPTGTARRVAGIRNTLLYGFTGVGLRNFLTSYIGISEEISGQRVANSLRQRVTQMRPAGLATLTRPDPYDLDFLLRLESAVVKHLAMRTRPLNMRTSVGEASQQRLTPADRTLADALAGQVADSISAYALGGLHNVVAWRYPNARDLAAALIHRLGRAIDTHQVVQMIAAAGASLNNLHQSDVARRNLIQREKDGGNVRVGHVKYDRLAVFHPAGVMTPEQALADYAAQRRAHRHGRLPIPAPRSSGWCPCPYCTPTTPLTTAPFTTVTAAPTTKSA
jgi:hypothetical protein